MFCVNCGTKLGNKEKFCTECGTKVEERENGKTVKLVVTRKKKVMGCAIPFPVYVDGEKIGSLANGKSVETEVSLGDHRVELRCVEKTVGKDIVVNNTHEEVEVTCFGTMGLVAAVAVITGVDYR